MQKVSGIHFLVTSYGLKIYRNIALTSHERSNKQFIIG